MKSKISLCDLNIPWPATDYTTEPSPQSIQNLKRIIQILLHFNYTDVVLNFELDPSVKLSGKEFEIASPNPIDLTLFKDFEGKIKIFTRITVTLNDPADFAGFRRFSNHFDVLAIRPLNEKSLQNSITNLNIDIITFPFEDNIRFWLKNKTIHGGIMKGRKFEIVYRSLFDSKSRRNFINSAKNIIRASRSVGIVISSGATSPLHIRSKFDMECMCKMLGISHHQIAQVLQKNSTDALISGKLRTQSLQQAISAGDELLKSYPLTGKDTLTRYKRRCEDPDHELGVLNKISRLEK